MAGLPHVPPRMPQYGFLYFPPFRVQGYSIAGEETFVQVPELDICFDIGRAPRLALASPQVALTHGHMDHTAGLVYYFSQRYFQGMGPGTVYAHPTLVEPIKRLMNAWVEIEAQRTPYRVIGMNPDDPTAERQIKSNYILRCYATDHTVPSLGYAIVEKRSKLKDQYVGLPQEKLVDLKKQGEEITYIREIPLIACTGDTGPGQHFDRDDVANANILITECTFLDHDHRDRARVGKHMHLSDLVELLPRVNAEHIVITHLSRRTHIAAARKLLDEMIPAEHRPRIHLLMDSRTNRQRHQQQMQQAEQPADERQGA